MAVNFRSLYCIKRTFSANQSEHKRFRSSTPCKFVKFACKVYKVVKKLHMYVRGAWERVWSFLRVYGLKLSGSHLYKKNIDSLNGSLHFLSEPDNRLCYAWLQRERETVTFKESGAYTVPMALIMRSALLGRFGGQALHSKNQDCISFQGYATL